VVNNMTKDDIITLPHSSLRQRSKKVGYVGDEIKKLIEQMRLSTLDWEDSRAHEVGVALAAVQINKLIRVVIVRNNFDDKKDKSFKAFINPEITKYEGEIVEDYEGCLSIKDVYGKVPRYEKVKVKALDETGRPFRVTATGFLARVLQHEIDHTNGIVFIDHLKDNQEAYFKLNQEGKIEPLDYKKEVEGNSELWD
jgi:peptide deformylase